MRLKKLLAVTLGLSMMFAVPAYANDADAVAAYQQMEQKSKEMTDMDAYYDYTMQMSRRISILPEALDICIV